MHEITLLFRIVFGNQKRTAALIGLLNAILAREGDARIRELEIQNPLREKDRLDEKSSVLDVKAKDGLRPRLTIGSGRFTTGLVWSVSNRL